MTRNPCVPAQQPEVMSQGHITCRRGCYCNRDPRTTHVCVTLTAGEHNKPAENSASANAADSAEYTTWKAPEPNARAAYFAAQGLPLPVGCGPDGRMP